MFQPVDDAFTMRHGRQARIAVTANDLGVFDAAALEVVSPPAFGAAMAHDDGTLHYAHTLGQPVTDTFTYRMAETNGNPPSGTATVTVHFTTAPRFNSDFVHFPAEAPPTPWQLNDALSGVTFDAPSDFCAVPDDAGALLIAEGVGRVWQIAAKDSPSPQKRLFLNITNRVYYDGNERALKGVACHPAFVTNGYFFVTYNATGETVRLSRFSRSSENPEAVDPESEQVFIEQANQGIFHSIGTCRFGPDGYLYVSFGDEDNGAQRDAFDNSQHIDKDLWSTVIRIDVDKRPGNLEPNPDPDIPRDGTGAAFFSVPADNPFVGATNFNRQSVDPDLVRTEMYVVGLRNPWQLSFDPGTNRLWVGDVGRNAREEISLLAPGDNAGWAWREGTSTGPRSGQTINGATEADATLVEPFVDYGRELGAAVTGGFVYEGTNYPGLTGRYVFGDYVSGRMWGLDTAALAGALLELAVEPGIVAFMPDPANGDILALDRGHLIPTPGSGRLLRLAIQTNETALPQTLQATGFFADLASLELNPGIEAYAPNLSFWSDHADKQRWFLLRATNSTIGFSREGAWSFPPGMILAKHFDMELERGNPATRKRLETRFLITTDQGAYGLSYQWNEAGTEAVLVPALGADLALPVVEGGVPRVQHYRIPARAECVSCHTAEAGSVLSFTTRQLNRAGELGGMAGNQLDLLATVGYLDGLEASPAVLPRHVRSDEMAYSLEARARAYLAVNCAFCHQPGGTARAVWDGRPERNLWQTGLINALTVGGALDPTHRLIVPGDLPRSVVWNRVAATNGYSRMPPLATREVDQEGVALLADWIANRLPGRQDYDAWRLDHFDGPTDPEGERAADPDGDGVSNEAEFLAGTDPHDAHDYYRPEFDATPAAVRLALPAQPGRRVTVETSRDLGLTDPWEPWDVAGNDGLVPVDGVTRVLTEPLRESGGFYRIRIEEE